MGLQPLDLQVMYQQSNNVAKIAGSHQAAQLAQSMEQQQTVNKNLENTTKVQQASNDKSDSQSVSDKGGGNGGAYGSASGKGSSNSDNENPDGAQKKYGNLKESYLGTIIDISR